MVPKNTKPISIIACLLVLGHSDHLADNGFCLCFKRSFQKQGVSMQSAYWEWSLVNASSQTVARNCLGMCQLAWPEITALLV